MLLNVRMEETLEKRAAARCANELGRAILCMRALKGLGEADGYYGVDFIRLAEWAFFNEMFRHAILALNRSKNPEHNFWFLYKVRRHEADDFLAQLNLSLDPIESILEKIKLIRDKTHFHLDKRGVSAPTQVWSDADITFDQLSSGLNIAFSVTCHLHKLIRGSEFILPEYDGSDAKRVAEVAYQQKLLQGQWRDPNCPSNIWD